ncbi:MAG: hypothetical protein AAF485_21370, partial [Chloroflexota bacterium]
REVVRAYKQAMALGGKNKFSLQSTLSQLQLLEALNFRPEYVKAGIEVIQKTLNKSYVMEEVQLSDEETQDPPQVFLFSGHMLDEPNRSEPRFPAGMENEARENIQKALEALNAHNYDLAITAGAACGGDILFIEACLERGMSVEVYLPFQEARFIETSVSFAGDDWVERFHRIRLDPNVTIHLQPERLGDVPKGEDPFRRNNRWALYSTLGYGIERVRLVVLWNGKGGDGPGGTDDMVQDVRRLGGIVKHLDTNKFDYWTAQGKVGKVLDLLAKG